MSNPHAYITNITITLHIIALSTFSNPMTSVKVPLTDQISVIEQGESESST